LHLGVPAADAVSKVDAGIDQRFNKFGGRGSHKQILRINGKMPAADVTSEGQDFGAAVGLRVDEDVKQ
jgi:hypothetical protein